MRRLLAIAVLIGFRITLTPTAAQAAPVSVGVELALVVDVSGSIDSNEFNLQRTGYVNAFSNPMIHNLIANTPGGIAVALIYWSGASQHQLAVGWTQLTDATSANAFAAAIGSAGRPFSGLTAPGSAINCIVPLFGSNNFVGDKLVIDVSGDGARNDGDNTLDARNAALAAGIDQINGLPILGETGLLAFYQNNIQGGSGSFTLPASSFDDFEAAITVKLAREISEGAVPEPMSMAVFGFGALVAGGLHRRNRKAQAA
jgi:hypothetical protein